MKDHQEGGQPHSDVHRRIAAALADLVPADPGVPPHPYLRRHLAEHAARGQVLDDAHVPPALLPWESSREVRRLLATDDGNPEDSRWLRTWAGLEPFARTVDPVSLMTSLQLAHSIAGYSDAPSSQPTTFVNPPVTLEWSDKPTLPRPWGITRYTVTAMVAVEDFRGCTALIAAGDDRGNLHVLRRDGSNAYAPLSVHDGIIEHLLALPGGIVVSGGTDGSVHVIDARHGRHLAEAIPRRPGTWVSSLTLYRPPNHPRVMMAAFSDGHLVALNIGTFHATEVALPENLSYPPVLTGLPTSEEWDRLLYTQHDEVLSFDGTRSTHQLRTPARIRALVALPASASFAVGDEAGNLFLGTTGTTGTAATVGTASTRHQAVHTSHRAAVTALMATQVDQHTALAASDAHGRVRLWELPDFRPIGNPLPAHTEPITALSSLTVGTRELLLTAGADCTLRSLPLTEEAFATAPPVQERITASSLSPTVPHLLATASASCVAVRDIATRQSARTILENVDVTALAWPGIKGTQHLAVALDDNRILVIDPTDPHGDPRHELSGHNLPARTLVPLSDPHSDLLASAGPDGRICLWNLRTGELLADFPDHDLSVQCLATTRTHDSLLLASGGKDGNVRVWDTYTFEQRGPTIRCDQFIVNDLAFAPGPDGMRTLASAGQDGSLKLWNAVSGSQVGCFDAEDGELSAVTALPLTAGRQVLVAAGRSSIHVWETARGTRKLLQIVTGRPIRALRTVADRRRDRSALVLATGDDGTSVFRLHLDRI
jgi:WD40 repeat protein